jgi:hypothetical protein
MRYARIVLSVVLTAALFSVVASACKDRGDTSGLKSSPDVPDADAVRNASAIIILN